MVIVMDELFKWFVNFYITTLLPLTVIVYLPDIINKIKCHYSKSKRLS